MASTQFDCTSSDNIVRISGHFTITHFRRVLAVLQELIDQRGLRVIQLDFSECKFTHATPMLALATASEHYQSKGINFVLVLPKKARMARIFQGFNWAHIIDPIKYRPSDMKSLVHLPALHYRTSNEQHRLVDDLLNKMLASVTGFQRTHFKAIEWSINEITDNVLVHAQSQQGGLVQLTAIHDAKRVEFVVCDCGIGIPRSLQSQSASLKISSDVDALARAIEQGVTRDKSVGQGNGLYGSYQIAVKSGANFSVHSGRATLFYTQKTGMHTRREAVPMPGTMVVCGIDYSQPLLLEEALNIKTVRFSPVDMIETKYETTSDRNINFVLKTEATSFGSRVSGTPVRTKLRNLIAFLDSNKVIVDFEDVHLVSSSFADEVFGKLFVELGPLGFSASLEMRNIDPIVKLLIDKAIVQRMGSPGPPEL